jgi:hypothetical protein
MSSTTAGRSGASDSERVHVTGWVVFASVLLITAGVLNILNGFTLLQHGSYYTQHIVYSNLNFWGWMFLIWGVLQLLSGMFAWRGSVAWTAVAVGLTATAAMLWFFMIFAAPWPAVMGITLNTVAMFAFTAGAKPDQYY